MEGIIKKAIHDLHKIGSHGCANEVEALVNRAEAAEAKLATERQDRIIPEGLNRYTAELVLDFAKAIAEKLHQSEIKYGWSDGWKESDWRAKCLTDFHHHIGKGDPRDVAAYCAFMWHHEWPTRPAPAADLTALVPEQATDSQFDGLSISKAKGWNACRAAMLAKLENNK